MSGQYFSLETVISGNYAKFPIRMMLSPNSTLDVSMDFSLLKWSLDYIKDIREPNFFIVVPLRPDCVPLNDVCAI